MANLAIANGYDKPWKRASQLKVILDDSSFRALSLPILQTALPRGAITEVQGARSSGRTSLCLHILAQATQKGEICAVVDLQDGFHPASAEAAGVRLEQLVWVRCGGNAEFALRAADLLLHAGGFGVVYLDLCEASARILNRIPLSYWHRFKKTVKDTPTVLLVAADLPQVKSCSSICLHIKLKVISWLGTRCASVLDGVETYAVMGKVASIRPQSLFLKSRV